MANPQQHLAAFCARYDPLLHALLAARDGVLVQIRFPSHSLHHRFPLAGSLPIFGVLYGHV
jgi:hypothetical protein